MDGVSLDTSLQKEQNHNGDAHSTKSHLGPVDIVHFVSPDMGTAPGPRRGQGLVPGMSYRYSRPLEEFHPFGTAVLIPIENLREAKAVNRLGAFQAGAESDEEE